MKKILSILLIICIFITGCGNSWKDKFKVSNFVESPFKDSIMADVKNTTNDTYYEVNVTIEFKDGDDVEEKTYNIHQLNPNSSDTLLIIPPFDYSTYEIKNIEYREDPLYQNSKEFFFYVKKVICIKDIRCPHCNQLLLKAEIVKGEIKCIRCRNIIKIDTSKTELRATH